MPDSRLRDLAELVITVLDLQAKYFKSRAPADLIAAKQMEKALRTKAANILAEVER